MSVICDIDFYFLWVIAGTYKILSSHCESTRARYSVSTPTRGRSVHISILLRVSLSGSHTKENVSRSVSGWLQTSDAGHFQDSRLIIYIFLPNFYILLFCRLQPQPRLNQDILCDEGDCKLQTWMYINVGTITLILLQLQRIIPYIWIWN